MEPAGEPHRAEGPHVGRAERLLGLVVALMGSQHPLDRATVRARVPGYAGPATEAAFERMFERDKDELRSMGVPIETVRDAHDEVLGYRIEQSSYALPNLELTAAERSVVAVAAQVWGQAALADAAGSARRKLDDSDEPWTPAGLRGSLQLTASDAALLPLMTAVRARSVVRFAYRGLADDAPHDRTVSVWGLRSARGAWFCVGHDHDRGAQRTFRLSRIVGTVSVCAAPAAVPTPPGFDIAAIDLAPASGDPVTARVRVAPGRAASVRQLSTSDDGWVAPEVTVTAPSLDRLVSAVCAAGQDAVVLDPPTVVSAVRAALQAVLDRGAHR